MPSSPLVLFTVGMTAYQFIILFLCYRQPHIRAAGEILTGYYYTSAKSYGLVWKNTLAA